VKVSSAQSSVGSFELRTSNQIDFLMADDCFYHRVNGEGTESAEFLFNHELFLETERGH
jgi:hypothetical protein